MENKKGYSNIQIWILYLTIITTLSYIIARQIIFFTVDYVWYEKIIAFLLLLAEFFIIIHALGYIIEVIRVLKNGKIYNRVEDIKVKTDGLDHEELENEPFVAIVIPSLNEPLDILENTLTTCCNLTYANKDIFLLDDTRYDGSNDEYKKKIEKLCKRKKVALFRHTWRGAKAGMLNDFLAFLRKEQKSDVSCQFIKDDFEKHNSKYLIVFDADQNPFLDFIEPLVRYMEKKKNTAFIQTPQYYTNFEKNKVAKASGLQQAVFYEYISEGKSLADSMICCGTNIIYRLEAVNEVGGFDENSITEDFALSFKLHQNGWHSHYYGRIGAFGMGPEDLGAYFKQQYRWAAGTIDTFKTTVKAFFHNPKQLSWIKWWEYFLSGTYYFIGFVFLILFICPVLFIFFSIPSYFANPWIYGLIFGPYLLFGMTSFFMTLYHRGYKAKDLFLGQLLIMFTFPVYIRGAIAGLFTKKKKFVITPKGDSKKISYYKLWPQLLVGFIALEAIFWGCTRLYYEKHLFFALAINIFWCLYNVIIMSMAFYYNNPEKAEPIIEENKNGI